MLIFSYKNKEGVCMLVSKCCGSYVLVEGQTTHYYACQQCGKAADLIEKKLGEEKSVDHSGTKDS